VINRRCRGSGFTKNPCLWKPIHTLPPGDQAEGEMGAHLILRISNDLFLARRSDLCRYLTAIPQETHVRTDSIDECACLDSRGSINSVSQRSLRRTDPAIVRPVDLKS